MADKNRDKIPEKVRQQQEKQLEDFLLEEKTINAAIEKIKELQLG